MIHKIRPSLLSLALLLPSIATAADIIPMPAEQRSALGIEVTPLTAVSASANTALEVNAQVMLPPASVRLVAAPADGLITTLLHQAGETVKAGDKVASLSAPAVVEAQRQYLQARLKYQLAADNAARDQRLADQGLIARNTWLLTQSDVKLAQADQEAAIATLRLLGVKPGSDSAEITLTAPISGWILETLVEPGQRVEAPAALVKIGNLRQLSLEIPLTPAQAKDVQAGQTVTLRDSQLSGTVRALQPALDNAQNVIVRADITQADSTTLHPGQTVKVTLQSASNADTTAAASIPTSGLVWSGDQAYVFTESAEGFTPTAVKIVQQNDTQATISGLPADSRIATKGVAALKAKWQEAEE